MPEIEEYVITYGDSEYNILLYSESFFISTGTEQYFITEE